jgi:aldose 1-epimerase
MLTQIPFGQDLQGRPAQAWCLRSATGLEAWLLDHGATLARLQVPGADGAMYDAVLGFASLAPYQRIHPYLGAVVGRYANRIRDGRFVQDGHPVLLARNDGAHHLHGGPEGFDRRAWSARAIDEGVSPAIEFTLVSDDGDQGYPGRLEASVLYRLAADALHIDYIARTDRPTPVNLTQHAYFNLSGDADPEALLAQHLRVRASRYLPVDGDLLPTGERRDVTGSPFDLRTGPSIRDALRTDGVQEDRIGFDHCFVLDDGPRSPRLAAALWSPTRARRLRVYTDQPGLQVYTGNFLDGSLVGRDGAPLQRHAGLCLETQRFPDGPNHPDWGDVMLRPGEVYRHSTVLAFDAGGHATD